MLSAIYQSQGFTIYPQRQAIAKDGEEIQVRSKTFSLLLLLLAQPGQVLSKSYLMENIWDDVKVEEQVLVQSIRELRQLFGSADIIQTYPRKGYSWAATVELVEQNQAPKIETPSPTLKNSRRKIYASASAIVITVLALCVIFFKPFTRLSDQSTAVVIVLPVKNLLPGNDYNWVPLGAMDQLIHLLVPDKGVQVMFSDYVFQIMRYAHLEQNYETEQVPKLFEVSGATFIVESQLSGAVEDFRLDYKLRTRNDVKRGVIFDKDINQAIYKLGQIVVTQTGQKLQDVDNNAQASFVNELMARGVERFDKGDFESAQNLFKSLLQLEHDNLFAREQLIKTMLKLHQYDAAKEQIHINLQLAEKKQSDMQARMYFFLAVTNLEQGNPEAALLNLDHTDEFSASGRELLVGSAAASMRARIYLDRGNLSLAQNAFEKSLSYDKLIRCSIGQSDNHLNLAELLLKQGKKEQAAQHYQSAKKLVETHQLDAMKPRLEKFKLN